MIDQSPPPRPGSPRIHRRSRARRHWITATALTVGLLALPALAFGAGKIDKIEQCGNGAFGAPVDNCAAQGGNTGWITGAYNHANSHYREGDTVPFRATFSGLTVGQHYTFTIKYDHHVNAKPGVWGYDHLTTYDRSTAADPCAAGACADGTTPDSKIDIPQDPLAASSSALAGGPQHISLWNATAGIGPAVYVEPAEFPLARGLKISFTPTAAKVVIAWGGHIASAVDWGAGNGAGSLPGKNWHMADGGLYAGDTFVDTSSRDLQGDVTPPPALTTAVRQATEGGSIELGDAPVALGDIGSVFDRATVEPEADGTITFYLCRSAAGCETGGTQIGNPVDIGPGDKKKTGQADSDTLTQDDLNAATETDAENLYGTYCFRAEYTPAANEAHSRAVHTNDTTECFTVVETPPSTSTITVNKIVTGAGEILTPSFPMGITAGDAQRHPFALGNGESDSFLFSNSDEQGRQFTVDEDELTDEGYRFDRIECTVADADESVVNGEDQSVTFSLRPGENADCTVTNLKRPTVTVYKDVLGAPDDPQTFPVTLSGPDGVVADTQISTAEPFGPMALDPGSYTFSEGDLPSGYRFHNLWCSSTETEGSDEPTANFTVDWGDDVVCYLSNVRLPRLIVKKQVLGTTATDVAFPFTLTGTDIELGDSQERLTVNNGGEQTVALDTDQAYTVTEDDPPAGYAFVSVTCSFDEGVQPEQSDGEPTEEPFEINGPTVTLGSLWWGDTATCTYTNRKLPMVKVTKRVINGAGDPQPFGMTLTGQSPFTLADGQSTGFAVEPGTFTLAEGSVADGYTFTGTTCTIGGRTITNAAATQATTFDLATGDEADCVVTNTKNLPAPPPPPPPAVEAQAVPPAPPVVINRTAKLAITKTAPTKVVSGKRFMYTIRVRNTSKVVATQVVMTDPLPRGLVFVRSTPKGTVTGRTVTVKLGNMKPKQVKTVKITVRSIKTLKGTRVNIAIAVASNAKAVRAKASTVFRPVPKRVIKPAVTG